MCLAAGPNRRIQSVKEDAGREWSIGGNPDMANRLLLSPTRNNRGNRQSNKAMGIQLWGRLCGLTMVSPGLKDALEL